MLVPLEPICTSRLRLKFVPLLTVASLPKKIERVLPTEFPNDTAAPPLIMMFVPAVRNTSANVPATAPTLVMLPPIVTVLAPDPTYSSDELLPPAGLLMARLLNWKFPVPLWVTLTTIPLGSPLP